MIGEKVMEKEYEVIKDIYIINIVKAADDPKCGEFLAALEEFVTNRATYPTGTKLVGWILEKTTWIKWLLEKGFITEVEGAKLPLSIISRYTKHATQINPQYDFTAPSKPSQNMLYFLYKEGVIHE